MSLFPETATGEWRFHFAESVPVTNQQEQPRDAGDG
jgi:hypothetical protein